MAKSSRASSNKKNHQALRRKIFDPAENARAARLNAKLEELVSQPTEREAGKMDVEDSDAVAKEVQREVEMQVAREGGVEGEDDMEIDGQSTTSKKSSNSASRAKRAGGRIQKKRRGKAQSTIVFPKFDAKRRSTRTAKRGAQK